MPDRIGLFAFLGLLLVATTVPTVALANEGQGLDESAAVWTREADLPSARSAHAVVADARAIHVLGGTGGDGKPVLDVDRYDGKRWTRSGRIPGEGLNAPAAAIVGNGLYLIGGFGTTTNQPLSTVHRLNLETGQWSQVAPLPAPRGGHAAIVVDGRIHVIGGGNSQSTIDDHDVYDPETDRWSGRAALPRAMGSPAAVIHEGRLYSVGGRSGSQDFGDVYVHDADKDLWLAGPGMAPRGTGGAIVVDGAIHYFGGESQPARSVLGDVLRLDPRTGRWSEVSQLPTPRNFARVVSFQGAVWVIGGSQGYGSSHAAVGSTVVERWVPARRAP